MQNVIRNLADLLLIDLFQKNSIGANISKSEFDVMVEAYKKDHEEKVNSSRQLTIEQKNKLKELFNKASDSIKDYCQECLHLNGKLVK